MKHKKNDDGGTSYLPLAADDELLEAVRGQFDRLHRLLGLGEPFVLEASVGGESEAVKWCEREKETTLRQFARQ